MVRSYKYIVDVAAQTSKFEQNMIKATSEARKLAGATGNVATEGNKLNSSLGIMGSGLGKLALMIGGPIGAISLLAGAIKSVEGPGDKFEEIIGGGKEALYELQKAIVTVDFTNLLNKLGEGFERGKKFAQMMDELADKTAYSDWKVAGLRAQSAELQETIKNKTLDISVRTKYAEDRNKIEEQIMNRTQDIATKTFLIEKQKWEETNKMAADEAIKLYESIDAWSGEVQTKMAEAFSQAKKDLSPRSSLDEIAKRVAKITDYNIAAIDVYKQYLQLLETGEADVLPKLFTAYKNIDQVRFESQRSYNLSVRETSMLLNVEEGQLETIITRAKELSGLPGLKQPGVNSKPLESMLSNELMPTNNPYKPGMKMPEKTQMDEISDFLKSGEIEATLFMDAINGLSGAFESLFKGTEGGMKGVVTSVLEGSKTIINALLAQAIAGVIAGESKKGLIGLVTASIGVAALMALWKTKVPEFASGAIVYGPTIAKLGEYPGARSNPEVAAPLDKLKNLINVQQAVPQSMRLALDGGGSLIAYLEYKQKHLNNYR